MDASILAEFDPFASTSHDTPSSGSSSQSPGTPVKEDVEAGDRQQGHPPGLILSGIYPSGQETTPAVAEEVDVQANKSSGDSRPSIPERSTSRNTEKEGEETSSLETPSRPSSSSAPRTPSSSKGKQEPQSSSNAKGKQTASSKRTTDEEDRGPVFDFQGFLVQLRSRSAEPIQKYLKR